MIRFFGEMANGVGLGAQASDAPDGRLVETVEGRSRLATGHALDLGCGTGRNSIYLARHSWEVTGIDFVRHAVAAARRNAAAAGATVRLIEGDVTRLEELGIGDG
jgi:methylase of polypeptide subunit release factors